MGKKVVWYEKGTNVVKQVLYESNTDDIDIKQLNNILLIRDGDTIAKCIFDEIADNGQGRYRASISDLPTLPIMGINVVNDFVQSRDGISEKLGIDSYQKINIFNSGIVPVICNNQDYNRQTAMNTFRDWTGLFGRTYPLSYGKFHTNVSYKKEDMDKYKNILAGKYKLLTEKKPKYYAGYVFLSYAFELYDGSITKPTPPRMILLGDKYNKNMVWIHTIDCDTPGNETWFDMRCFFNNYHTPLDGGINDQRNIPEHKLMVSKISAVFQKTDLKGKYDKDIIKSIIVYCSKPVPVYDFEKTEIEYLHFVLGRSMNGAGDDDDYDTIVRNGWTGYVYSGDEASGLPNSFMGRYNLAFNREFNKEGLVPTKFTEEVINSIVLYRVEKFYIGEDKDNIRELDLSSIQANENINVDASGWWNTAGDMFVYNQRLHLFNYRQEFKIDANNIIGRS
jgi:hypothetical protein